MEHASSAMVIKSLTKISKDVYAVTRITFKTIKTNVFHVRIKVYTMTDNVFAFTIIL